MSNMEKVLRPRNDVRITMTPDECSSTLALGSPIRKNHIKSLSTKPVVVTRGLNFAWEIRLPTDRR